MSMARPEVSIVIPVKGHPVLLDDAIASVHREMAGGVITRLIVVDDGCPYPETRASLSAWQAVLGARMLVLHNPNGGLSRARNQGIDAALRLDAYLDALFLLDADNLLAEGSGEAMARLLQAHPAADWFYPEFDFFGQPAHYVTEPEFDLLLQAEANQCDAGSLIRRRLLDRGIRFDETMRQGYEDWDFWLQAAQAGFRGRAAGQPLLLYRKRPASMLSSSHEVDHDLRRFLRRKHGWLYNPSSLIALEAARYPRFALVTGEERRVTTCVDPDHQQALTAAEFEQQVLASMAAPHRHHAPAHLIFLRHGVEALLDGARLMHGVLWNLERRAARNPAQMDLLYLDRHPTGGLDIRTAEGGLPDRPADLICLPLARAQDWIRQGDEDQLRRLDLPPEGHAVTRWTLRLPVAVDGLAGRAGAGEVLRGEMLALARSPFRQALQSDWRWREPGAAISRDRVVQIPRMAVEGGVTFPLIRVPGQTRIGIVLPIFSMGGVERVAASLARELAAAGHRLHLFIVSDRPIETDDWSLAPFATITWLPDADALDWSGREYLGTAEPSWGGAMQAADLMGLLGGMDVVINAHSAAVHKVADRLRRRGVVMIDHEHLLERSTYGRGYGPPHLALAYEQAYDLFLTCSQTLTTWMHANGVPRDKLMAVVNAPGYPMSGAEQRCMAGFRRAARARDEPMRVLFLGRMDKQKGIDRLCKLYHILSEKVPGMVLTVAGRSVVDGDGATLIWPPTTRFSGPVRGAPALTQLLTQTDIMVLPSHYEGLPLSILEAQRCGVVPVATKAGAIYEAIEDGVTGFVVPQDDCVDRMAALILRLNRDRRQLARMAHAATERSRTWHVATHDLRDWLDLRLAHLRQPTPHPVPDRQSFLKAE
ncbi:glycosyltransferase [Paracoccus nototheniae]|uniref:glycosyltransferase n=1 Tax=Paracoccus nototheniae TaxID=2489002 RepID=UPI00103FD3B6|nr:glycosyltransferase [Paracoccus nototheniae]